MIFRSLGVVLFCGFLLGLYFISDEHRTLKEPLSWECLGVDKDAARGSQVSEHARFWFIKDRRYQIEGFGPHLCSELAATGQSEVTATYEVWGNRVQGLHGYNPLGISAGVKKIEVSSATGLQGDFHEEAGNVESDSARSHSPLEVFK